MSNKQNYESYLINVKELRDKLEKASINKFNFRSYLTYIFESGEDVMHITIPNIKNFANLYLYTVVKKGAQTGISKFISDNNFKLYSLETLNLTEKSIKVPTATFKSKKVINVISTKNSLILSERYNNLDEMYNIFINDTINVMRHYKNGTFLYSRGPFSLLLDIKYKVGDNLVNYVNSKLKLKHGDIYYRGYMYFNIHE